MVYDSLPNVFQSNYCDGNSDSNVCQLKYSDGHRDGNVCQKKVADKFPSSLHDDIHNVIEKMGPPTPIYSLDLTSDSPDDTTISSYSSKNTSSTVGGSNSSFVEVLIKNHHNKRKSKNLKENKNDENETKKYTKVNQCHIQNNPKPIKEVHFNSYQSLTSEGQEHKEKIGGNTKPMINDPHQQTEVPTNNNIPFYMNLPPCPHAPCPHAPFHQMCSQNSMMDPNMSKPNPWEMNGNNPWPNYGNQDYGKDPNNPNAVYNPNNPNAVHNPSNPNGVNDPNSIFPSKSSLFKKGEKKSKTITEIYYFDHGNAAYYHTTDNPPMIIADYFAEKAEHTSTKFWAQIFGMANVAISLVTTFILQLLRFLLFSIVRPLTVGLICIFSDYFVKPFLSSVFNGLIQPILIFIFNILTSLRDICKPIAYAFGLFTREIAVIFRACRFVEVKKNTGTTV